MPCDSRIPKGVTKQQRQQQVKDAVARLEKALQAGTVTVKVGPTGAVSFAGWGKERDDVSDLCAYRKLSSASSWALRQATARAEAMAGRKIDPRQIAAGTHSHDGGDTWHPGH